MLHTRSFQSLFTNCFSDLALRRPASQSSTSTGAAADRAVDGQPSNQWSQSSCAQTKTENNPWWRVDLGSSFPVAEVFIVSCGGTCGDGLKGFRITIGELGFF